MRMRHDPAGRTPHHRWRPRLRLDPKPCIIAGHTDHVEPGKANQKVAALAVATDNTAARSRIEHRRGPRESGGVVTPILEGLDPTHPADTPTVGSTLTPRSSTKSRFSRVVHKFTELAFSRRTAPKLDAINLIKSKFLTQFYMDVASGFSNVSHLRPLIARLNHRSEMLRRCFHFVGTQDKFSRPVTTINLRYCSIEERKLIPLLVTRARYKTQKDSFHSDHYLNIIIDEAHNLLSYESSHESETWRNTRLEMFEEVLKEGRKFGVFVTLASQRPHDISPTITSQLHHYLLHQLVNPKDIDAVQRAVSYLDATSFDELSSLPRGTCIISGTSVQIPAIVKIDELPAERRPDNETIDIVKLWGLAPDSSEEAGNTEVGSVDTQESESTAEES